MKYVHKIKHEEHNVTVMSNGVEYTNPRIVYSEENDFSWDFKKLVYIGLIIDVIIIIAAIISGSAFVLGAGIIALVWSLTDLLVKHPYLSFETDGPEKKVEELDVGDAEASE